MATGDTLTWGVYTVLGLLILSKLADVLSTLGRIRHADEETNPMARALMRRVGLSGAAWLVFALAILIIGVTARAAIAGDLGMKILFIVAGTGISVVQAAVAHTNWTGRDNFITRRARMLHGRLQDSLDQTRARRGGPG